MSKGAVNHQNAFLPPLEACALPMSKACLSAPHFPIGPIKSWMYDQPINLNVGNYSFFGSGPGTFTFGPQVLPCCPGYLSGCLELCLPCTCLRTCSAGGAHLDAMVAAVLWGFLFLLPPLALTVEMLLLYCYFYSSFVEWG